MDTWVGTGTGNPPAYVDIAVRLVPARLLLPADPCRRAENPTGGPFDMRREGPRCGVNIQNALGHLVPSGLRCVFPNESVPRMDLVTEVSLLAELRGSP